MSASHDRAENLLGALVTALDDRIRAAVDREAGQQGRTPAALVQLAEHPGLTVNELRRRLGLTHSAVVRLVDRLVERGLATRSPHREDARAVRLRLSRRGRAVARSVAAARLRVLREALADLPATQRAELERVSDLLLRTLPRDADESSQICRLCALSTCPQPRCPVEQCYVRFVGEEHGHDGAGADMATR